MVSGSVIAHKVGPAVSVDVSEVCVCAFVVAQVRAEDDLRVLVCTVPDRDLVRGRACFFKKQLRIESASRVNAQRTRVRLAYR